MAEYSVTYSHRDENGDRLRVECWPETIEVDAEDAHDGERVSVSLTHEEGVKLARAILAALDAEPEVGLTVITLEALPPGAVVIDKDGDEWVKQSDGLWQFYSMKRGSGLLVDAYGPITAKDGDALDEVHHLRAEVEKAKPQGNVTRIDFGGGVP